MPFRSLQFDTMYEWRLTPYFINRSLGMTKISDESWKDGCYWVWPMMKDVHCCNSSPDLYPLPLIVQTQPLCTQMCRTTFWVPPPILGWSTGLHWIRSYDSSLWYEDNLNKDIAGLFIFLCEFLLDEGAESCMLGLLFFLILTAFPSLCNCNMTNLPRVPQWSVWYYECLIGSLWKYH